MVHNVKDYGPMKLKNFEEKEDNLIAKSKDFVEILRKSKKIVVICKEDPTF